VAMLAVYFFGDTNVNVASVSAGAFALAGLLLGARLSRNSEHEKWLREKRLEWLGEFIEATYLLTLARRLSKEARDRAGERAIAAMSRVEVLAPEDVQRLSSALQAAAYEYAKSQEGGNPTSDVEQAAKKKFFDHWHLFIAQARQTVGVAGAAGVETRGGRPLERFPGIPR
jgi:hypothetical protein